ncbi:MAG TPA: DUF1127 domain-containing protein [Stellaceae bacterium]|nr:DUF1127 domain-containing protein [Stellaceae bacterium]
MGTISKWAGRLTPAAQPSSPRGSPLVWLHEVLAGCIERAAQRHHLANLDEHSLRDLGLTRSDVVREVDKPFWRR